ncbi:leucine-rich repeat protein 1 [Cephus cinctus]|uniref:Leucine-rich repeat protein 1 n=1 Tax=Cephus cinctus TaxID=211228 RepID=A0AAJ7CH00_CEPCN|nr:leucine-rich repeat protein 1 [Cephus cinctus]
MKLMCTVEVSNRLLSSTNIPWKRKGQRSCLGIGRNSLKDDELYIFLQTPQNRQGVKYKVDHNIEKVFTKFINDGKATIRIIEPPHDLIITGDAVQLKSFLHVLKLGVYNKPQLDVLSISNLKPKSLTAGPKTKVTIRKKSEYPVLQGFPRTTEELCIIGLERKSFDRQILRLQRLRVLNLTENQITSLPKEMGSLPNLQELILAQNHLGKMPMSNWTWLDGEGVAKSLKLLDISCNGMHIVPEKIRKLTALVTLKMSRNVLKVLPQSIGSMTNLRYLDLSMNDLSHLPGSIKNLRLMNIDVSGNLLNGVNRYVVHSMKFPSLVELASRRFLKTRKLYDASTIPYTLVKYLDEAQYCVCGSAFFDSYLRRPVPFNLNDIAASIRTSGDCIVPLDCYFCSTQCLAQASLNMVIL